jgi:hypothetical protein
MMFKELKPEETELIGMWLDLGGKVMGDAVADRVIWLTETKLEKLADHPEEPAALYRDPRDARLWEKVHPFVNGPPALRCITPADAAARFGVTC